jgi:hypothetical protein
MGGRWIPALHRVLRCQAFPSRRACRQLQTGRANHGVRIGQGEARHHRAKERQKGKAGHEIGFADFCNCIPHTYGFGSGLTEHRCDGLGM